MRTLYITLFCLLGSTLLFANNDNYFSDNPKEFLDEMEQLVLPSKPAEGKKLISELREIFNQNKVSQIEFQVMLSTNNLMASRELKTNPYFFKYLDGVIELKKNKNCQANFISWHEVIDGILKNTKEKSPKQLKVFLAFSIPFFKDGSLYYSKTGTSWNASLEKFNMDFSNNQPRIIFEKTQLIAQSKKGKIQITETSGTFLPLKNQWLGKGGKTFWKDHHLALQDVYCELSNYKLNTKKGLYKADSVSFYHPTLFPNQSILGKLDHKIVAAKKKEPSTYPRFKSYDQDLVFKDFFKNAKISGGIKLSGTELQCYGDAETPAKWIQMNSSKKKYFEFTSPIIMIKDKHEVYAKKCNTKIFFDENFIHHPSAKIKYSSQDKTMSMIAESDGRPSGPFYDSYHQVHIYSPSMDVMFNEKEIVINNKKIKLGNKSHRVTFESANVWKEKEYERIKAFSNVSPIIVMANMTRQEGKKTFTVAEIAEALNFQNKPSALTGLFVDLMKKGFIIYFHDKKEVEILDKTLRYFEIKEEDSDYDQIVLNSNIDKTNAVFDMKKKEIEIEGVKVLEFSRKRKVAVQPLDEKINLLQNRGMDFSGEIFAGNTLINGTKFHFDYENFKIVMDSIEHIEIFTEEEMGAQNDKTKLTSLGSRIEGVSGVILIDDPKNKSGKEEIENFPRFETASSGYVYYDSKEFQEGIFGRDSFYFELDKFAFNNMNEIANEELKFKGQFTSHGIFPTMEALLEVQPDGQLLGFQKNLSPSGLPIFKEKGNFAGLLALDQKGLKGNGKISALNATFTSDDITFLPQQLTCVSNTFGITNRSGANPLPLVEGDSAQINWSPTKDTMHISPLGKPLKLFSKRSHKFEGDLILTSDSLAGNGIVRWDLGTLKSEDIRFSENGIQSDFADLEFKNKNESSIAIDTKNVNANINFKKKKSRFKSQKRKGTVDFPASFYKTSLLDFDWDMANETVTFHSETEPFGKFTSTHPDKDSLNFMAESSTFDLKTGLLHIDGVQGISSADSWIEIADKKITIGKTGEIETIQNGIIFSGGKNKFHVLKNAEVEIINKNRFTGRGDYEYILDTKTQVIQNLEIEGDKFGKGKKAKLKSEINGTIAEEDNFFIKEKINFHGDISMNSHAKNLKFSGFAKMSTSGNYQMHWFEMEHNTEKNDSTIAFVNPRNPDGESLHTGIFIGRESRTLYPTVMMPLQNRKDRSIFKASGVLKIAEDHQSFLLGDSTKVASPQNMGNIVQLPIDASHIEAIGKFEVDTFLNPIKLKLVGKADISFLKNESNDSTPLDTTDFKIKALAGLDIPLPKSLMRIILVDIQASNFDAKSNIHKDKDFFLNVLPEFLNTPQDLSKAFKNLTSNELLVLPEKKYKHTFLLSNLNLKWNQENQSFISTNNEVGLVSINGTPVNNLLDGYFQLKLTTNENDRLYFYLKSPSGNFYYFGFNNGILDTYSNNEKYNESVSDLKKKEREIKLDDGNLFEIMLGSSSSANNFLNRIKYMQESYKK